MPGAEQSAIEALGASKFDIEFEAGRELNREAGLRLALGEPALRAAPKPDPAEGALLGQRETEVAHLVAEGLSNKQIAVRLLISEHTVDSHLRNIFNRLGVNSRAQIANWVASSTSGH